MSVLLSTNFAQLLFKHPPSFPTASPLLHLGSDDSIGSSFKRISIREAVVCTSLESYQCLSILPSLSLCLSLCIASWFRFTPVPPYICLCLETGGASSPAISRGGLKCQQSGREKSAFPLTLGVISGWNELAGCQGGHLVASVVSRGGKEIMTLRKKKKRLVITC